MKNGKKRLMSFVMLGTAFAMISACVPGADPEGSNSSLTVTPGDFCPPGHADNWLVCPGGGEQFCDRRNGERATSCTDRTLCAVPRGMPVADPDGGVCAPNEWRYCTAADTTLGFELCDVSGAWMACQSCGPAILPDGGTPADGGTGCESDPLIGTSCTVGLGECAATGAYVCDTGVLTCSATAGTPTSEVCDGLDNDCDGSIDEDVTRTCYSGPAGTRGVGQCVAGTQVCAAGAWGSCSGEVLPSAEIPDNDVDEDCNGGLLFSVSCGGDSRVGTSCSAGVGECMATGSWSCVGNELLCDAVPSAPTSELCDGLDNDCDGLIDEDLVRSFYSGPAGTASVGICRYGYETCAAGAWSLSSPEVLPSAETCGDGVDQDCNGGDLPCLTCGGDPRTGSVCMVGFGECSASGSFICDTGRVACDATPGSAVSESCDGLDNNCNGLIDEDLVQTCYSGDMRQAGIGLCRMGTRTCSAGSWGSCTGEVLPTAEICGDGIDQDCTGSDLPCTTCGGDARIGTSCTVGRGACMATGTWVCTADRAQCDAVPGMPAPEICDGVDNNCNGVTDEAAGGGALTSDCYPFTTGLPGVGICTSGTRTCSGGSWSTLCWGAVGPSAEVCDGLDNNCNGAADEGGVCSTPTLDAGTDAGSDAGVDSGTDAGTSSGALAERNACRANRSTDGWSGTQVATYDLSCVNSTFGMCASGWQVIVYDGHGCSVPSDPGVGTVSVDIDANAPGSFIRTGLRCGSWDYRTFPGPACTAPAMQCVTEFTADGVSRLADGRIADGAGGLLPTFPASASGGLITCP